MAHALGVPRSQSCERKPRLEDDIRYLEKESTPLRDTDTISIVPSIAGGSVADATAPPVTLSKDEILQAAT